MRLAARPIAAVVLLGLLVAVPPTRASAKPLPLAGLKVLVVSPTDADERIVWLRDLLTGSGAGVARATWATASSERVRASDLVVVTGGPRRIRGKVADDLERPVLGLGSHGLAWFGRLRLKHGAPFS